MSRVDVAQDGSFVDIPQDTSPDRMQMNSNKMCPVVSCSFSEDLTSRTMHTTRRSCDFNLMTEACHDDRSCQIPIWGNVHSGATELNNDTTPQ